MKNPNAIVSSDYGPIIININDSVIGKHINAFGYWSNDEINLIKSLVLKQIERLGSVVFYDIGANIGTHSLAIAKSFPSNLKIRAFEVQRQIFNMLCGTIAINGLSNVFCHNNAVSNSYGDILEIGLLDYCQYNNFGALEIMPPKNSDQQHVIKASVENVQTVTIDSFNEKVDFLKIDVEGMEDKVLMGANKTIQESRPIVFVEIHKTDSDFVINYFSQANDYIGFLTGINLVLIPLEYQLQINGSQRVM